MGLQVMPSPLNLHGRFAVAFAAAGVVCFLDDAFV
jgi:hypothetical protein